MSFVLILNPVIDLTLLGMRFSLQTREIIADSIETVTCAQHHDACITIPGCDKNMPGCIMAIARHNRPSLMIYGGTIAVGHSKLLRKPINISTCYEASGAYIYNTLKQPTSDGGDTTATKDQIMDDIEQHACPGAGACGGMYTANTMATAIESMGLSLPGSSSTPATSPAKMRECMKAAEAIKTCMERNIKPRDLLTARSFENALVMTMALGGSTNGVVHFLAMAATAGVSLSLADIQRVSDKIPFIADLAPSGRYFMADLYDIGGVPSVQKLLIVANLLDGGIPTITGLTLAENVSAFPSLDPHQTIIRPLSNPIKSSGHIQILRGNLAPGGAVAKITGKEGTTFTGQARCFDKENALDHALNRNLIPHSPNIVAIVRYEGPKGGPGMYVLPPPFFSLCLFSQNPAPPTNTSSYHPIIPIPSITPTPLHPTGPNNSKPPPPSWAPASRTSPSSPTAATRARATASSSGTSSPRRAWAGPSPPCGTATPSGSMPWPGGSMSWGEGRARRQGRASWRAG